MSVDGPLATHELTRGVPDPRLRGVVRAYTGYVERTGVPFGRLEVACTFVPIILSFGPEIRVDGERHRSFVAALTGRATVTEHGGEQHGIQIDLTPIGARRLLGLPMAEITDRVVPMGELLGEAERARERLWEADGWPARFAVLDELLLDRLSGSAPVAPELAYAVRRLQDSRGGVTIAALALETGWSRRHLSVRFASEVGLAPKTFARIRRFEWVTELLGKNGADSLADAAYRCGYADQSHLNRDFRAFAATTPTDYVARLLPDDGGVAAHDLAATWRDLVA
jgi:AraC-like DNA-binding protein